MKRLRYLRSVLAGGVSVVALVHPAAARVFDIPGGDLSSALAAYMKQSSVPLVYVDDAVHGHRSHGAKGDYTETAALTQILQGTGFTAVATQSSAIGIVPAQPKAPTQVKMAQANKPAAPPPQQSTLETVVVTAQKKTENIQTVPIAVTALSQQQLTERQIAGGPDLVKEVPNLTFSKTNFSGYNLEIRGIGTQAISVTTDPAVAVAFNDIPFIRNHFFEQEFFDVDNVEVLRGPQGTLYGRNATAGVVNLISAKPTDQYEAMLSADIGNYSNRRLEGMLNLPIVGDTLDLRIAGEWTKREGYTEDKTLNAPVDGRDLWSGRVTLGWKPASNVQTELVWEHFSEDDDRLRSGKQLCKTDYGPGEIGGMPKPVPGSGTMYSQGCLPDVSLYSPDAYEAPLGQTLPYVNALEIFQDNAGFNPYGSTTQSTNLRQIESSYLPHYIAKNDTLEFNANWTINPSLTFTSQTGYNNDFLWSTEDFNRFGASPGLFGANGSCDPQLGCSNSLIVVDLSDEHSWQFSQEFRLSSNFQGPFNFTAGGNYLHYETDEDYYVFSNALTALSGGLGPLYGYEYNQANQLHDLQLGHTYVDPNPISNLDNEGHNYYLNQNPYVLNSYAVFGDANFDVTKDLKLIGGLRWTDDQKHFLEVPSWVTDSGYGYPVTGVLNQSWQRFTGRAVANWTPELDFTDQTLVYASYAHGYKAGGANPPGAEYFSQINIPGSSLFENVDPVHPLTFKPEYIEAFEFGTKNTLLNGSLTLNGDIFYYNYTGYQISEIVDRTAINSNYNAHVEGAELEANWEPVPGLKFGFTSGFEDSGLAAGTSAIDLMDRTAGQPGWYVTKPFANTSSNCIFPTVVAQWLQYPTPVLGGTSLSYCQVAYAEGLDPLTGLPYTANPKVSLFSGNGYIDQALANGYPGFNPATAPNDGEGFAKNLSGNQLPNAPHFTAALTAEYSMPVSDDWVATLHTDLYWQSQQWARVVEDPIDKIHGYSNVNLSLILTSANGWQVMGYVKNVFNVTAITGTFLNSDDTGLTTNVFLTDPRLVGIRVTKHLDQNDGFWGGDYNGSDFFTGLFSDSDNGKPPLWLELGGAFELTNDTQQPFVAPFFVADAKALGVSPVRFEQPTRDGLDYTAALTFRPDGSDWVFTADVRYGRTKRNNHQHQQTNPGTVHFSFYGLQETDAPVNAHYLDAFDSYSSSHEIFDFMVGKDVGLGMFGLNGSSDINGGVRFVQFSQSSAFSIHTDPDYVFHALGPKYNHNYFASDHTKRSFHGLGPALAWDASTPVLDDSNSSEINLDWGMNGAVLFGRQIAHVTHQTSGIYQCRPIALGACKKGTFYTRFALPSLGTSEFRSHYQRSVGISRRRMVTVPNIGAFAGISWRYENAKVSFGYRADEFFGAMDGGIDTRKSENVGFFGPFANISIGLGG